MYIMEQAFGMFLVGFIETIKLFYSGGNLLDMLAICAVLLAPVLGGCLNERKSVCVCADTHSHVAWW